MKIIKGLYYTKNHEWVRVDGDFAYIGVTDFAQHSMGDIVFVEMPEIGDDVIAEDALGVVESVKAASDVYSPVSGKVIETNESLVDSPELINSEPYDSFLAKLEMSNSDELKELMTEDEYEVFCESIED
jgi:glycine cleavage system H protein